MVDANVHFGAGVLEACTAVGASLISASTVWQHFEGRPYAPVSAYAATKQAFDDLAEYYALFEDLPWTRLVLGDTCTARGTTGKSS